MVGKELRFNFLFRFLFIWSSFAGGLWAGEAATQPSPDQWACVFSYFHRKTILWVCSCAAFFSLKKCSLGGSNEFETFTGKKKSSSQFAPGTRMFYMQQADHSIPHRGQKCDRQRLEINLEITGKRLESTGTARRKMIQVIGARLRRTGGRF